MTYIHELKEWPHFQWDQKKLTEKLADIRHRQGRLIGRMESLGFSLRTEAMLEALTQDVVKSSEIEGEILNPEQVRSSIARRLGIEIGGLMPSDRNVDGIVEVMVDATRNYDKPLTDQRLFGWHAALFPTGRSGMTKITVGAWRTEQSGPMQVVSGPMGRERVQHEAPNAALLNREMDAFLVWFNGKVEIDPVLKAAVAHLWFVTIHPFEDGNGRIARAIADMALARSEHTSQRFYSMSAQIRKERDVYYNLLEDTQKGDLQITPWLSWFLNCLGRAFDGAEVVLANVFNKSRFWERYRHVAFNARQKDILNRLLGGFEGKLTSSKYAVIEKCSPDTALRDITELVEKGVLQKDVGGGRSTSYSLAENTDQSHGR